MHVIRARNVNSAFVQGIELIRQYGVARKSRYGDVLEIPEPVTTVYEKPLERVLFDPIRDANPFFHLFESLWILAGRDDVEWLVQFNKRMAEFSDNGETFHGAYGKRLRNWNGQEAGGMLVKQGMDQLAEVIKLLRIPRLAEPWCPSTILSLTLAPTPRTFPATTQSSSRAETTSST
jgi:hypothetical protein